MSTFLGLSRRLEQEESRAEVHAGRTRARILHQRPAKTRAAHSKTQKRDETILGKEESSRPARKPDSPICMARQTIRQYELAVMLTDNGREKDEN